jgi:hypothetical protein
MPHVGLGNIMGPSKIIQKYDRNSPFFCGFQADCIFIIILWIKWLAIKNNYVETNVL